MLTARQENILKLMIDDGNLNTDVEDDIVQGATVTRNGEIVHSMVKELMEQA